MKSKKKMSVKDAKLFNGDWIFDETCRMAYKLDKQGTLIFNCPEEIGDEEKIEFTIEALMHMGIDEDRAAQMAMTMEPVQ